MESKLTGMKTRSAAGTNSEEQTMGAVGQATPQPVSRGQFLTFYIAGEEYAVNILKVKEIIEFDTVTTVPNTAPWIRGVTNLRGNVVPVIDLAVKFGLPSSQTSKFSCIVITEVFYNSDKLTMGVMADSVNQVLDFLENDIEATPPFGTRVRLEFLLGMGKMGKKFCLILDIDKVLSADEIVAVTDSMQTFSAKTVSPRSASDNQSNKRAAESGV
jgi:purine-binding chemotaxis protein CheW